MGVVVIQEKGGWVYIMSNRPDGALHIGVTARLVQRVYEHREGLVEGHTKRYGLKRLVYFERHEEIVAAIAREKIVKKWPRDWRVRLIVQVNPDWRDLYEDIV
jgi:putative endonuclease